MQNKNIKSGRSPVGVGFGANVYATVNPTPLESGSRLREVASPAGPRAVLGLVSISRCRVSTMCWGCCHHTRFTLNSDRIPDIIYKIFTYFQLFELVDTCQLEKQDVHSEVRRRNVAASSILEVVRLTSPQAALCLLTHWKGQPVWRVGCFRWREPRGEASRGSRVYDSCIGRGCMRFGCR